ncbi:MAG: hypothetical protein HY721_17075, partial [Planctomycetes bacterium]|nr:hypothetical protein [Planctomycetota bacterium]
MTHTRPHTEAHDAQLAGSAEPRREARAASHEVVVVNRDPELRALLSRALYAADLPSAFVASDQELQACLRNGTRGLVVVSIESGESIELLSRLRRELAEVPLVAVARTATPDLVRDVMRAGATDFLFGSLDSRSLGPRLLALLEAASPASCSPVS